MAAGQTRQTQNGAARQVLGTVISLAVHGALVLAIFVLPDRRIDEQQKPIELIERKLPTPPKPKPKVEPAKPKVEPEKPKVEAPKPKPKPRKVVMRRRPPPPTKPPPPEPEGKPESKVPAAPDTGAKRFGITMEGSTAAPGTGVQVPRGDTLKQDPRVRRIGKGKPKPKGFKKAFKQGERAPVAVVTSMPRVAKRVAARYPERMRELGIEGRVVLQLTVGPSGKVVKVKVLKSLRKELDEAAIAAAKQMVFTPAKVGATAVTVKIPYTFTFVLD